MQKTKKILVPIDFSSCSENALAYAIHMAAKTNAVIHLLNIVQIANEATSNPLMVKMLVEEKTETARLSLIQSLHKIKKNVSPPIEKTLKIETVVEIGHPNPVISEIAKRDQIDFIIMGTQGVNSMSDRLLGSTASSIVKKAPCPLFVIPEEASFQSSVMMGYASNLSNSDPIEILRATKLLKPIQPVAIHCVHFGEKQKDTKDKLEGFESFFAENAPDLYINFYSVKTEDKVEDLNDFIASHKINLMTMYRPLRSFWKALFRESFTQKMSKHIKVPLLILNEENS